ncbi:oxidation resistance protein 1 [Coemansia thaxteri]|nr:oxidation resistance protein 1 [Coemansia thaxteri]KAJ2481538.1 oxidation resistance protein 1 [Coemansia sp. RSA 2320]
MSLRKYASSAELDESAAAVQPKSLASRLLHFGFGHSAGSDHGSDHHQQGDLSPISSQQLDDPQTTSGTSEYLLASPTLSSSAVHSLHMDDDAATRSASSEASHSSEADTARATHEAMNTPITIPHSRTAPAASGHSRPSAQLLGRNEDTPKVVTTTIANELRALLPVQQRLAKSWRLVYSMDQHGISFNTMLALCAREGAMVLAIKDSKGKAYRSSPESRKKDAVKNFRYTGENEYFVLCDPDFVAVGGGRGKFGLWFKSDFLHGYSARCPTFNNEPLGLDPGHPKNNDPDAQQEFVVSHLEIWAFN